MISEIGLIYVKNWEGTKDLRTSGSTNKNLANSILFYGGRVRKGRGKEWWIKQLGDHLPKYKYVV